jgi:flagellin
MATVDVTRIAGNLQALNTLNSMTSINKKLAVHQARLATGKRILEAADDPAGMVIATTFDVRRQGMKTALNAIGDAKNLMATMEGGLKKIKDILVKMRNKALEATGDTIGTAEKSAITDQLNAFAEEINDIVEQTEWNDNLLLGDDATASESRDFLHDADGNTRTFEFEAGTDIVDNQGFYSDVSASGSVATGTDLALNTTNLDVSTSSTQALAVVDGALDIVKEGIGQVGAFTARLTFKEEALTVAHANTEAAFNRIMNANMAEEQVEASKLLILQQTSTAMLAQANVAPQFLLSLFR